MKKKAPDKWIPREWTFRSGAVAARFDRHVREQLPWYDALLYSIEHIGAHYIPKDGVVFDVGASTGNVGRRLAPYLRDRNAKLISIEASPEMWKKASAIGYPGEFVVADALEYDFCRFDFCVCNLVLMFLKVSERGKFLRKLAGLVNDGGALVVVDKVLSPPGYLGTVLRRLPMKWKLEAGTSADEILAKELSLGGVQRPISTAILPVKAERFFQFGEFVGWVYERPEEGLER
jgi:tRNA (cmo5U34)-methyltransferase